MLKVQQLLHICSEHFDSKEKEEEKDKKDKKEKEKKEGSADMGAHQVRQGMQGFWPLSAQGKASSRICLLCPQARGAWLVSILFP